MNFTSNREGGVGIGERCNDSLICTSPSLHPVTAITNVNVRNLIGSPIPGQASLSAGYRACGTSTPFLTALFQSQSDQSVTSGVTVGHHLQ